jgi:outer membrane protein OmpA-like peptidoglycan-associated protein
MIQKRIQPDSKISITGHTDRVGEFNHNLELSVTRAKALSSGIKSDNILLYGMGENELLYDNDTPEGRFYCRRVDVVIETPIKE